MKAEWEEEGGEQRETEGQMWEDETDEEGEEDVLDWGGVCDSFLSV